MPIFLEGLHAGVAELKTMLPVLATVPVGVREAVR
jgi:hypothetical protein